MHQRLAEGNPMQQLSERRERRYEERLDFEVNSTVTFIVVSQKSSKSVKSETQGHRQLSEVRFFFSLNPLKRQKNRRRATKGVLGTVTGRQLGNLYILITLSPE